MPDKSMTWTAVAEKLPSFAGLCLMHDLKLSYLSNLVDDFLLCVQIQKTAIHSFERLLSPVFLWYNVSRLRFSMVVLCVCPQSTFADNNACAS